MQDIIGGFQYETVGIDKIDLVRPLWEKLNAHHADLPGPFSYDLRLRRFQDRKAGFLEKGKKSAIRIELVSAAGAKEYIAYSIITLSAEKHGEIESIFVEEARRNSGIGAELMKRALEWLDGHGARSKSVIVLYQNDAVIRFYQRFGFLPWNAMLVQKVRVP